MQWSPKCSAKGCSCKDEKGEKVVMQWPGKQLIPSHRKIYNHHTVQAEALFERQDKVLQSSGSPLHHWCHSCSSLGGHQQMHVSSLLLQHPRHFWKIFIGYSNRKSAGKNTKIQRMKMAGRANGRCFSPNHSSDGSWSTLLGGLIVPPVGTYSCVLLRSWSDTIKILE